jgi:branched-chain amino acid transport system permease protein
MPSPRRARRRCLAGAAYISVPFKDAFAFLVLILFLALRPQGIFGERVAEKA